MRMHEILLYRGCTTPVRLSEYESSTKIVLKELGVEATDLVNANCCGAQFVESLYPKAHAALSGRILALAEQQEKDILAICGACSGSLKHIKHSLDSNESIRKEVNGLLAHEGLKYTGNVKVKHLLQIFNEDIGYRALEKAIVRPYHGVRMAAHYGCHVTRPFEIVKVDDPENPTIIDRIIQITGATAVDYTSKTQCCGGPLLAMDEELATKIGAGKINNVIHAGALGLVTACAFCQIQLTQTQLGSESLVTNRIPIITLPQFLGYAMGLDYNDLGLFLNPISAHHTVFRTGEEVA